MRNRAVLFARPRARQDEDDGFEREEALLERLDAEMAWIDLEANDGGVATLPVELDALELCQALLETR